MSFFHFLRHFNSVTLQEFSNRKNRQRFLDILIPISQNTYRLLLTILKSIIKYILRRIIRFFQFIYYLNLSTIKEVFNCAAKQRLSGLSAEMAYHAMLALFPALLTIIAAIGIFDSLSLTLFQMGGLLIDILPNQIRFLISWAVDEIQSSPNKEIFSFSFIVSIWIFSSVVSSAMAALDAIHQVPIEEKRPFWKAKLVSLGLTIGSLILLIIASTLVLVSDLIVDIIARQSCLLETLPNCPPDQVAICLFQEPIDNCILKSQLLETWSQLRWPITLGIVSTAFAFVYRFGPSYRKKGTPIMPGAIISALMWAGASNLFRLYVFHFGFSFENYNRIYGTIGTFIILLLWLYISSFVVLIGAQLNVTVGEEMVKKKEVMPFHRIKKSKFKSQK
ncbi:YihY/virulence factor BrkB family protein [Okeania sp.]|uniref:YihY/virulence factor BrkB family protein n=1 Tax=Okeania sp. TaxID=3100323 RepID=UPI002B4B5876|nr:YihY/virulence factor BrkB family protein [Okeania sp.]MEB3342852.1 YihY/virulence factor BrkB family protein [Okeania sp.]